MSKAAVILIPLVIIGVLIIGGFGIYNGLVSAQEEVKTSWAQVENTITYSVWAFLTSSGNTIFEYVDILVISYFMAVSEVGVYGVCWTFSFLATCQESGAAYRFRCAITPPPRASRPAVRPSGSAS
jgi:O-antigen/teichoic acid export membrane protein